MFNITRDLDLIEISPLRSDLMGRNEGYSGSVSGRGTSAADNGIAEDEDPSCNVVAYEALVPSGGVAATSRQTPAGYLTTGSQNNASDPFSEPAKTIPRSDHRRVQRARPRAPGRARQSVRWHRSNQIILRAASEVRDSIK